MARSEVTIYDIAEKLSVTPSTVSRALNDHPRISKKTKQAVHKLAKKLNYQHNAIASALRSGKTNLIGVMVPTVNVHFFSSVIKGIEQIAKESGYSVMITQSNDQEEDEVSSIDAMLRAQVDGVLASVARDSTTYKHYQRITQKQIPLVLFDRDAPIPSASSVVTDDYQGAYLATEHLLQEGCRRIAHFAGQLHLNTYKSRLKGYKDALEQYGVKVEEELIYISNTYLEDGQRGMEQLLQLPHPPDGVFSASDYAALGAIQVLKERNIKIPSEVALIGFANEPFASFIDPQLSSVNTTNENMGRFAAKIFLDQVSLDQEVFAPSKTVLSPELIIRASSKRN